VNFVLKNLGTLGDRVLGMIVPKARAAACTCWYVSCPPGSPMSQRECCKIGGHLYCESCDG
jgi:hypothetical protein